MHSVAGRQPSTMAWNNAQQSGGRDVVPQFYVRCESADIGGGRRQGAGVT